MVIIFLVTKITLQQVQGDFYKNLCASDPDMGRDNLPRGPALKTKK